MLQDDVIKLVLENVLSGFVAQGREEVGVVPHFELAFLGHAHTSSGNAARPLVNPSRECREKRLINQQTVNVQAKIKRLDLPRRFQQSIDLVVGHIGNVGDVGCAHDCFVGHFGSSVRGLVVSHVISYSLSITHLGLKCKCLFFILK